ncbi:hypothetical protein EDD21DRAFT_432985 [Dissophora ornata]|nr:hypothetical protein EDD21DRAFT_432985 [Dissophora ornata]
MSARQAVERWRIGGVAHTATRGNRYGTKSFVAKARDSRTYNLTPGVHISDIGKEMGRDGIDTDWIQFTYIRIPRTNMMMKHPEVSYTGEVKEPPMTQLNYGALSQGRVAIVVDAVDIEKKAATMAVLAQAYALHFTGVESNKLYEELMDKLESTQPHDASMGETLGGHGYFAYPCLATTYNDFAVHFTCEGSNTILTLQSGRHLVNCYREALTRKTQPEGIDHLNNIDTLHTQGRAVKTLEEIMDFDAVKSASEGLHPVLTKKCILCGLYSIKQDSGSFLQYRCFTPSQMDLVCPLVNVLYCDIRQEYILLIDSFNYSDYMINSAFGVYDGNVYEKCFD